MTTSFQAHELVYCSKCYLSYDTQVNITKKVHSDGEVNWYLTNCGHVLCSNCLVITDTTSSTSCPKCQSIANIVTLSDEVLA